MSTHLTHAGVWLQCEDESVCGLSIHLQLKPAEVSSLPLWMMLPLLEAFDPPSLVEADGTKIWLNQYGMEHRGYDLPSTVSPNGYMRWCFDGVLHRDNKPAVIYPNGYMQWCRNGERHRNDGPAVVFPDGRQDWYIRGKWHQPPVKV